MIRDLWLEGVTFQTVLIDLYVSDDAVEKNTIIVTFYTVCNPKI